MRISTDECEIPDLEERTGRVYDVILEIGIPESQGGRQEVNHAPEENERNRRKDQGQEAADENDKENEEEEGRSNKKTESQERKLIIAREELRQRFGETNNVARMRIRNKNHGDTTQARNGDARNKTNTCYGCGSERHLLKDCGLPIQNQRRKTRVSQETKAARNPADIQITIREPYNCGKPQNERQCGKKNKRPGRTRSRKGLDTPKSGQTPEHRRSRARLTP